MREFYLAVRFIEVLAAFLIVATAYIGIFRWLKRK
jgi:hypothetical protein